MVGLTFPIFIMLIGGLFFFSVLICYTDRNLKKQTPLFTKYSLYTLSSNSNFSNKKAKKELGFKNRNMKNTIEDTIEWLNKQKIQCRKKE